MIFAIGKRSKIALGVRPGSAVSINYETIEKSLEMLLFWQMAWCGENSLNKSYTWGLLLGVLMVGAGLENVISNMFPCS